MYRTRADDELSWRQERSATLSLELIREYAKRKDCIVDAGGGSSQLSSQLWEDGFRCITVVDIAESGLARAQSRLRAPHQEIKWLRRDLARASRLPKCEVWHDRAVFHFFVQAGARAAYVANLRGSLEPGGVAIIATFAPDGPEKCSGLPVQRYAAPELARALGSGFLLESSRRELHSTPWGTTQPFCYAVVRRTGPPN